MRNQEEDTLTRVGHPGHSLRHYGANFRNTYSLFSLLLLLLLSFCCSRGESGMLGEMGKLLRREKRIVLCEPLTDCQLLLGILGLLCK